MATVSFKRSPNVNNIPIVDGQLIFDELNNKIYMDNGTQRLQYGGDISLIDNIDYATNNNAFSALATKNLFLRKTSVVDSKDDALAATEHYVPVGCLAFQSAIGTSDYSAIGNTISDALVTLNNTDSEIISELTANNNRIYMDYHNGKYGYNTDPNRGADTFTPFKIAPIIVGTFSGNGDVNVRQAITEAGYDFSTFTVNNFIMQGTQVSATGGNAQGWYSTGAYVSKTYDANTGIISVSGAYASTPTTTSGSVSVTLSGNILLAP